MLTASALVIAVVGVFAGMKKTSVSTIYFKSTGGVCHLFIANAAIANFTNSGTTQATIKTNGGTRLPLYSVSNCSAFDPVYLKN